MAGPFMAGPMLLDALRAAGIAMPNNVRAAQIVADIDGAVRLQLEILLEAEQLHRIAVAVSAWLVAERLAE